MLKLGISLTKRVQGGSKSERILDRFDNSPLLDSLSDCSVLSFILVAGLYTVKRIRLPVTTEFNPLKDSSPSSEKRNKEEKRKKEEEKNIEAAEKAVVQMETTPSQDSVNATQAAVKKNDATDTIA